MLHSAPLFEGIACGWIRAQRPDIASQALRMTVSRIVQRINHDRRQAESESAAGMNAHTAKGSNLGKWSRQATVHVPQLPLRILR